MPKYEQGDIILIPYPYTDLSNTKQRPVVIISKNSINKQQFIVAKVTSVIRNDEFAFPLYPSSLDRELKRKSEVRTNEVFTVHRKVVRKKFATLKRSALKDLIKQVAKQVEVE